MEASDPDVLRAMTEAVVAAVAPSRVILFGSRAAGRAGPEADVDLLVVADEPFEKEQDRLDEMVRLWTALAPFRVPTDLLVYSEDEVARWGTTTNHVVARALRDGRVLYERPSTP